MLEKTKGAIKNGYFRDTGNIGYRTKTSVTREHNTEN